MARQKAEKFEGQDTTLEGQNAARRWLNQWRSSKPSMS